MPPIEPVTGGGWWLDLGWVCGNVVAMRITGGRARGIMLRCPTKGGEVRPATDYMREAVFSSLAARVPDARVLDLFAGTGSYGLEALSRGAASLVAVEKARGAQAAWKENAVGVERALGLGLGALPARLVAGDALSWEAEPGSALFDLVFCDPPYVLLEERAADVVARAARWLAAGAESRLLVEAPGELEPPACAGLVFLKRLGKGGARQPGIWVYAREVAEAPAEQE